jgi:hypothetical protein
VSQATKNNYGYAKTVGKRMRHNTCGPQERSPYEEIRVVTEARVEKAAERRERAINARAKTGLKPESSRAYAGSGALAL